MRAARMRGAGDWRRLKRVVVGAVLLATLVVGGGQKLIAELGGASTREPEELEAGLSAGGRALLQQAYRDIDPARLMDYHTHMLGLDTSGSGTWVNPLMMTWWAPLRRLRFAVYLHGSRVLDLKRADTQYLERLTGLIRHQPQAGRHQIMAFDYHHNLDGTVNRPKSEFYTPNEYVFALAEKYPQWFVPTMSVHPYRADALEALEKWAARGGVMIKWLPNAMGIDAAAAKLDPYYAKVKELGLTIITHVGLEKAVEAEEDQRFGNPLRFRRPLEQGVRVVMAHCASLGDDEDLDNPGAAPQPSFDLFMRLMDEKKYEGLLFGELSAVTLFNRIGKPLSTLLRRTDLHHRFVNGSDYPLPAINVVVRTGDLLEQGYITRDERQALNEIYDFNPLLFDFVLRRTIRAPSSGEQFAASVFHEKAEFGQRP